MIEESKLDGGVEDVEMVKIPVAECIVISATGENNLQ